jgi:hypothetical protein
MELKTMGTMNKFWHWPDHMIGKRESRVLREEHNQVVNLNCDLVAALEALHSCHRAFSLKNEWTVLDDDARKLAEEALAKAQGGQ